MNFHSFSCQVRPVVETGYENVLLVRLLLESRTPSIRKSSVGKMLMALIFIISYHIVAIENHVTGTRFIVYDDASGLESASAFK